MEYYYTLEHFQSIRTKLRARFWFCFICLLATLCYTPSFAQEKEARNQEQILQELSQAKTSEQKLKLYERLYDMYMQFDHHSAWNTLEEMHQLAKQNSSFKWIARTEGLKGEYYIANRKPTQGLQHYRKQLSYFNSRSSDDKQRSKIFCTIGLAFNELNKPDSALLYFGKALDICRTIDCGETYCAVLNNLGMTLFQIGNTKQSESYFEEAYSCMLENGASKDLDNIIYNLFVLSIVNGKPNIEKQVDHLLKNDLISKSNTKKALLYLNVGGYYQRNSNWTEAKKYFMKADSIHHILGEQNPEVLHALGLIYGKEKNYLKAKEYFQKIRKLFPHYNQAYDLFRDMARTYMTAQEIDSAKFYYELALNESDSLRTKSISEAFERTQHHIDFIRKEAKIRDLTLQQKIREKDETQIRFIGISIIIVLLLLVIIVVLFFRKERSKRKLREALIERKNERIKDFAEKVESRNKAIEEIEKKFASYRDMQDMQDQLKEDVIESLVLDGDKDVFGYYFEDQHKGFYEAIKKIAPSMTNNDLRLCSLSRMRLSLKETAEILNISVDAVKSGRYRVRKKLDLSAEESLSDYLNKLN